jgi:hypothetical protein
MSFSSLDCYSNHGLAPGNMQPGFVDVAVSTRQPTKNEGECQQIPACTACQKAANPGTTCLVWAVLVPCGSKEGASDSLPQESQARSSAAVSTKQLPHVRLEEVEATTRRHSQRNAKDGQVEEKQDRLRNMRIRKDGLLVLILQPKLTSKQKYITLHKSGQACACPLGSWPLPCIQRKVKDRVPHAT